jgi:hypothetical protein
LTDADRGAALLADGALVLAPLVRAFEVAAPVLTDGMVSHMPAFNDDGWTLFALCKAATVTPSLEAILFMVSPGRTR